MNKSTSSGAPEAAPARCAEFTGLSLAALRDYRSMLSVEETRVSYWRRLVQARLDMIKDGAAHGGSSLRRLRSVLADSVQNSRRTALLAVVPEQDMPPLPNLAELYGREPGADPATNAALVAELTSAERALSLYRKALHRRLATATDELIARYREDPCRSLAALPASALTRQHARSL